MASGVNENDNIEDAATNNDVPLNNFTSGIDLPLAHFNVDLTEPNLYLQAKATSKYKRFYSNLRKCYEFLLKKNANFLQMYQQNRKSSHLPQSIEELLDEFALKVASKKDLHEKRAVQVASAEGNHAFMAKRWKNRYYVLLDISGALQNLIRANRAIKMQGNLHNRQPKYEQQVDLLIDELRLLCTPPCHLCPDATEQQTPREQINLVSCADYNGVLSKYVESDIMVPLSSVFLMDLLTNFKMCSQKVKQQLEVKPHLLYLLRKEKANRDRLRLLSGQLNAEALMLQKSLKQLQNLLSSNSQSRQEEKKTDDNKAAQNEIKLGTSVCEACKRDELTEAQLTAEAQILEEEGHRLEGKIRELESALREEGAQRKSIAKRLQAVTGTVHVYCKLRWDENSCIEHLSDDKILVHLPAPACGMSSSKLEDKSETRCFIFDGVYPPSAKNEDIFLNIEQLIASALTGHAVGLLICGQDKAIATRTLFGNPETHETGFAQLAVNHLFALMAKKKSRWRYSVFCFSLGYQSKEVNNLLSSHPQKATIDQNACDKFELIDRQTCGIPIASAADFASFLDWLMDGGREKQRTQQNVITILKILGEHAHDPERKFASWLYLAELSAVMNFSTHDSQHHLKEMTSPSRMDTVCSASTLGDLHSIFTTLRRHQKPNFRASLLTHLLQPVLTGLSRCLIIMSVSTCPGDVCIALAHLNFATNAVQATMETSDLRRIRPITVA